VSRGAAFPAAAGPGLPPEQRAAPEGAARAQHRLAVGLHQALREDELAGHLQDLGFALDPARQRRRREEVDLQADRRQELARDVGLVLRRGRDQDVGERGEHAAVALAAGVDVRRADPKAELQPAVEPAAEERSVVTGEGAADLDRNEAGRGGRCK